MTSSADNDDDEEEEEEEESDGIENEEHFVFNHCFSELPEAWHEALEILQLGPFCHKIRSDAIKAIAIYCPNLRKFRLSGIRDINGDAINAPAKHCLSFIKIGFVDCHNIDEVAVSNVVPLQFLSVAGTTRMNWGLVSQNWTKLPNFICL